MKLVRELCLYKYSRWLPWWKFIILKVRRIWKKRFRLVCYRKVSKCCWSWSSNTLAIWCEEPTLWKRPWCWERLKAGREGDDWGWDGWLVSPIQWTWVWANSGRWWQIGKPGMPQSMESQRVGHDWATKEQIVSTSTRMGNGLNNYSTLVDSNTRRFEMFCSWPLYSLSRSKMESSPPLPSVFPPHALHGVFDGRFLWDFFPVW